MNTIIICGRLCRDPEVRYSQGANSTSIARMTVAVNRRYKREGEADADFFNCVAFGKNAEFAEKYLKQGNKVIIRGSMKQDDYTNKDGNKVYSWVLNIDEIDFGESKPSGDKAADAQKKPKAEKKPAAAEPKVDENGFMDIPDDLEMPFN